MKVKKLFEMNDSDYNQYSIYFDFLPRMIKWVPNSLLAHPEVEDFNLRSKKGYNEFTPYRRNKLTYENETLDWFIYDKESMNFLHEMNNQEFHDFLGLKYVNGKVYFEDKCATAEDNSDDDDDDDDLSDDDSDSNKEQKEQKEKSKKIDKIIANFTLEHKVQDDIKSFSKKIEIDSKSTAL